VCTTAEGLETLINVMVCSASRALGGGERPGERADGEPEPEREVLCGRPERTELKPLPSLIVKCSIGGLTTFHPTPSKSVGQIEIRKKEEQGLCGIS
jgi:hypothetical protein